jgi:hypothetical protein
MGSMVRGWPHRRILPDVMLPGMILELIATFCTAIFAGAAIYINLVEHPATLRIANSRIRSSISAACRRRPC